MSALVGIGYDCHRFAEGRALILAGVSIPHTRGLDGHSDADVLSHAVTDAVLGAAGLGDIGEHFPDSDERFKGADSLALLRTALALVRERAGLVPHNVDTTICMQAPKLGEHRAAIRERLAQTLALPPSRVNVKATTGEGMGFIGREEGVAALAVATLVAVETSQTVGP